VAARRRQLIKVFGPEFATKAVDTRVFSIHCYQDLAHSMLAKDREHGSRNSQGVSLTLKRRIQFNPEVPDVLDGRAIL
jgi:hypothetical protein